MTGLFIIAHHPLASALRAAAMHTYPELAQAIAVYDVPPGNNREQYVAEAQAVLGATPAGETLILIDVSGASTPCVIASRLLGPGRRVLAGVNVPMLWRALNYRELPLDAVLALARDGAVLGVHALDAPPPQNQAQKPIAHDPNDPDHHQ